MLEPIFHILGLCPDNLSHPDLLNMILMSTDQTRIYFSGRKLLRILRKIADVIFQPR